MSWFTSESFNSLDELLVHQIKDLYDAEHRIADALPKMADKAHNADLRQGLEKHLAETRGQIDRLEKMFSALGKSPERTTCEATKGLIEEGEEVLNAKGDNDVLDAALIASAQRVEHYEIAGYGTIRALARRLGHEQVAQLADETLREESNQDEQLTRVAESEVNVAAAH
jgi:ferritin-like metal-binding protein YciE